MCLKKAQNIMTTILRDVDYICRKNNISYWIESGTLLGAVRHGGFIPWDDDIDIGMLREDYNKFIKIAQYQLKDDLFLENMDNNKDSSFQWTKVRHKYSKFDEEESRGSHQGIFIDIFPYDYLNEYNLDLFKRKKWLRIYYKIINYSKKNLTKPYYKQFNRNAKIILCKILNKIIGNKQYSDFNNKLKSCIKDINNKEDIKISYGVELICFNNTFNIDDIFPLREIDFQNIKVMGPNNNHNCLKEFYGENYMELPKEKDRAWHNDGIYIYKNRD